MKLGMLWPIAIIGVLAITVGANIYLLWQARDPGVYVVEPDYYQKAVHWDSTQVARAREARLGWRLDAHLGPVGRARGAVRATLADSSGAPVAGAIVELDAVNNLDASHFVHARLLETAPGLYAADAVLPRAGLWELRFALRRGAERFSADLRRDAAESP